MRREVTCRELTEFLSDYLAGELPPPAREEFERHLSLCPSCASYTDSFRKAVRMGEAAFECLGVAVPAEVPEELVQAILAARRAKDR